MCSGYPLPNFPVSLPAGLRAAERLASSRSAYSAGFSRYEHGGRPDASFGTPSRNRTCAFGISDQGATTTLMGVRMLSGIPLTALPGVPSCAPRTQVSRDLSKVRAGGPDISFGTSPGNRTPIFCLEGRHASLYASEVWLRPTDSNCVRRAYETPLGANPITTAMVDTKGIGP